MTAGFAKPGRWVDGGIAATATIARRLRRKSHEVTACVLCYHSFVAAEQGTESSTAISADRQEEVAQRRYVANSRSVSMAVFAEQVTWLQREFRIVPLTHIVDLLEQGGGAEAGPPLVALTFDDGYQDNLDHAIPYLKSLDVPVTWFVANSFVQDPQRWPWWDLMDLARDTRQKIKMPEASQLMAEEFMATGKSGWDLSLPQDRLHWEQQVRREIKLAAPETVDAYCQWLRNSVDHRGLENGYVREDDLVRALQWSGLTLGVHSANHYNLARCDAQRVSDEVRVNRRWLAALCRKASIEQPIDMAAYPFGSAQCVNVDAAAAIADSGMRAAFTTQADYIGVGKTARSEPISAEVDRYRWLLPRIVVGPGMSREKFRALVGGGLPLRRGMGKALRPLTGLLGRQ